jgi:hypothetical protein
VKEARNFSIIATLRGKVVLQLLRSFDDDG